MGVGTVVAVEPGDTIQAVAINGNYAYYLTGNGSLKRVLK